MNAQFVEGMKAQGWEPDIVIEELAPCFSCGTLMDGFTFLRGIEAPRVFLGCPDCGRTVELEPRFIGAVDLPFADGLLDMPVHLH